VDVGAFDGIHLSNTFSFERIGWQGICIEAHPDYFPLLKRNRPRSLCLHYACVKQPGLKKIDFQLEKMGLLSSILTTADYEDDVRLRYTKRGLPFEGFQTVTVPAATLDELLAAHYDPSVPMDLISIDVEGSEAEVLYGFDVDRYAPRVLVVEANSDPARTKIMDLLIREHNYFYAGQLVENLFFTREESDGRRMRDIEIQCRIERQSHPLGNEYSTEEYLSGKVIDFTKWNRLDW
jgi:FkbM family methyltransferase